MVPRERKKREAEGERFEGAGGEDGEGYKVCFPDAEVVGGVRLWGVVRGRGWWEGEGGGKGRGEGEGGSGREGERGGGEVGFGEEA